MKCFGNESKRKRHSQFGKQQPQKESNSIHFCSARMLNLTPLYFGILAINNEAVWHFENGNLEQAKQLFEAALMQLKGTAQCYKDNLCKQRIRSDDENAMKSVERRPHVTFQWSVSPPTPSTKRNDTQLSYIYKRALSMIIEPPDFAGITNVPFAELHDENACITYNLALVNHLLGTYQGKDNLQWQALSLYQEAFDHFDSSTNGSCAPFQDEQVNVFGMAVTCNVGQLHFDVFANYDQATQNFAKLSAWVINALKPLNTGILVDQDSIQGFVFNAMLLKPTLASAA